jgi:tagaturonate reductase
MKQLSDQDNTPTLILQFGTSRFLQAHVDYFVGQSITFGYSTAPILVVQTSTSPAGKKRMQAMNQMPSYPVKIQGLLNGEIINTEEQISSIFSARQADIDWDEIESIFCDRVSHVVSNTADQGFVLDPNDCLSDRPPRSYPAKLLSLLFARYEKNSRPITLMPCELIANNGDVLKKLVIDLAKGWQLSAAFIVWLETDCIWANSLVDRIVSQAIEPLGAVAEPYALWAIENQPGLILPCQHPDIRIVDNLAPLEWLKLGLLNLSHSFLVDLWLQQKQPVLETVLEVMMDDKFRDELDSVLKEEVVPILMAMELGEDIIAYIESVRERFLNPFLQHQLKDIAQNHKLKIERRMLPLYQQAKRLKLELAMPRITTCLRRNGLQEQLC